MSRRLDATRARTSATPLVPPASKSDAQRALAAAFALGRPGLAPPLDLDGAPNDVRVFARGIEALVSDRAEVDIDCEDGGFPFRVLTCLAATRSFGRVRLFGSKRLGERPHQPLFQALGLTPHFWPVVVPGGALLREPRVVIDSSRSSQYASGLLFAAATMARRQSRDWVVATPGPMASAGYAALTIDWLGHAGFEIARSEADIRLSPPLGPPSPLPPIPGDWSSLGYLLLAAWATGSVVTRVDRASSHPDRAVLEALLRIGIGIDTERSDPASLRLTGRPVRGIELSAAVCPDSIPALGALAAILPAPSCFTEISILRDKESDRVEGLLQLLRAVGASGHLEGHDSLRIEPTRDPPLHFEVEGCGDHRLVMAGATLALLLGATALIADPGCVSKSFPSFWDELAKMGATLSP